MPHFYKFESLRKRIGNQKYEVECDASYEMVNVLGLIDDVGAKHLFSRRGHDPGIDSDAATYRDHIRTMIRTHQRRLQLLKEQQAQYGMAPPPEKVMETEKTEMEIRRLEVELQEIGVED